MRFCVTALLLLLGVLGGPAPAQSRQGAEDRLAQPALAKTAEAPHLALLRRDSGDPLLVVDYPWAIHAPASVSVEVRLSKPGERAKTNWAPVFFVANYLNADALKTIYRCQDLGENLPAKATFSKEKIQFEITGQRNSLERSAVAIHCLSELEGPRAGVRAIFWPLKEWSFDRRTLYLELPRKDFSEPCQIRVWFLRDAQILWGETFAWPGYPQKPSEAEAPKK